MVSATDPQRRNNNPNDQIGQMIVANDACVIADSGGDSAGSTMVPGNGEYTYGGTTGNCNYCIGCMPRQMDSSAGCLGFFDKCASGGGVLPQFYRNSYRADKNTCCTNGGGRTVGDLTCDPKYQGGPASGECNDVFATRCTPSMIANGDPQCNTWCANNRNTCNERTKEFCDSNNLAGDRGQFCKDRLIELGGADSQVNSFCASHTEDPFCACITSINTVLPTNADKNLQTVLANPQWYVKQCSAGNAYKTTNMRNSGQPPPLNICNNSIVVAGNNQVDLNNISQTCNQSIGINGQTDSSKKTDTIPDSNMLTKGYLSLKSKIEPTIQNTFGSGSTKWFDSLSVMYQMLLIFIVIILMSLGVMYLFDDTIFDDNSTIINDE
jgi:hypothetical protein